MHSGAIPVGDTVPTARFWSALDDCLHRRGLREQPLWFVIGAGEPSSPEGAHAWVAESAEEGYSLVRYIVLPQPGGAVLVELDAIKPLTE
jgi:hypothetical protein